MALNPGVRFGSYEVLSLLGAGGMGEVYQARDTALGRHVALKVLPEPFANDRDRLDRFKREAHLLAALNHPHIGSIYGVAESAGVSALVLELVEGPTLAGRVEQGALPPDEALAVALQIAEALETAHERGIVHRDLKPSNIKVRADGTVKVLDFGLAKALDPSAVSGDIAQAPTVTSPAATRLGMIMGTAAYMSPEQARGKPVDKRADVWAFGCVLYEMLTGTRAFPGDDVSETLARVIEREPDWKALDGTAPAAIARLVRRCLQKNPHDRLRDIGDARLELRDVLATSGDGTETESAVPRVRRLPVIVWPLAVVAALMVGAAGTLWLTQQTSRDAAFSGNAWQTFSTEINLSADAPLALDSQAANIGYDSTLLDISPDGRTLVYVGLSGGTSRLFARRLESFEVLALEGTEGAIHPFFSPDGRSVGFLTNDKVKAHSLATGATITICDARVPVVGTWTAGDQVFFATDEGRRLSRVSVRGGTPDVAAEAREGYRYGRVTPDGKQALVTFKREGISSDYAQILLLNLGTREARTLTADGYDARLTTNGYLVFGRSGTAFAAKFDPTRQALDGDAAPVASGVRMHPLYPHLQLAISGTGVLAYVPGGDIGLAGAAWVSRKGPVDFLPIEPRVYGMLDLSDDGRRLALHVADNKDYVLVYDIERNEARRLPTTESAGWPKWSPDGDALAFTSFGAGKPYRIMVQQLDSDRPPVTVVESEGRLTPATWSRDGRLTFYQFPANRLGFVSRTRDARWSAPEYLSFTGATHGVSPDGRWIAYSDGAFASVGGISVRPLTAGERVRKIADTGTEPRWCQACDEIIFRKGNQWFSVPVRLERDFEWSTPRPILRTEFNDSPGASWALSADGQRILVLKRRVELPRTRVRVIHGWLHGSLSR